MVAFVQSIAPFISLAALLLFFWTVVDFHRKQLALNRATRDLIFNINERLQLLEATARRISENG